MALSFVSPSWAQRIKRIINPSPLEEDLSPYQNILQNVNLQQERLRNSDNSQLVERVDILKQRFGSGRSQEEDLVEFYSLFREVAARTTGLRPFDVQLIAAMAMAEGKIVEMQTGEGKTLSAVAPACLHAWMGMGVHILTYNDYLAARDSQWMFPIYAFFGVEVACIQETMTTAERRKAYEADVVYASSKEVGFDLLRSDLATRSEEVLHKRLDCVIVDEADSILIDDARTPLVIAGPADYEENQLSNRVARFVAELKKGREYDIDENERNVHLTETGISWLEEEFGIDDLYQQENLGLLTTVNLALHAHALLQRDVDYIVRDGKIYLVDDFTGRIAENRRWPDGLQDALLAKENIQDDPGGRILSSTTKQSFIMLYKKRAGMSGTARAAAMEFFSTYGLNTVIVPPNQPCVRVDEEDRVFSSLEEKYAALVEEIAIIHKTGRPILIGTGSVRESEHLAKRLGEAGISHDVLNAKSDQHEAELVEKAGQVGAVTISTNMAGRGTDIKLGGPKEIDKQRVRNLGGLYVIGTTRHESRRIDQQLQGRSGRQGDPGTSRFFVSVEDTLMKRFGILRNVWKDTQEMSREIARAQRIIEGQNLDIRRTLSTYSLIIEAQRKNLYRQRSEILQSPDPVGIGPQLLPDHYQKLLNVYGFDQVHRVERDILLFQIDQLWSDHLNDLASFREGIHLLRYGQGLLTSNRDPVSVFQQTAMESFQRILDMIPTKVAETLNAIPLDLPKIGLQGLGLKRPSSTWTYLINDNPFDPVGTQFFKGLRDSIMVWIKSFNKNSHDCL